MVQESLALPAWNSVIAVLIDRIGAVFLCLYWAGTVRHPSYHWSVEELLRLVKCVKFYEMSPTSSQLQLKFLSKKKSEFLSLKVEPIKNQLKNDFFKRLLCYRFIFCTNHNNHKSLNNHHNHERLNNQNNLKRLNWFKRIKDFDAILVARQKLKASVIVCKKKFSKLPCHD